MSIVKCMERGVYIVENDDGGFEIHVKPHPEVVKHASDFKQLINDKLSWAGTDIHTCMTRHGDELHFQSASFSPWNKYQMTLVFDVIWFNVLIFEHEVLTKKRIRQVRDALNKCKSLKKVEQIAEILGV